MPSSGVSTGEVPRNDLDMPYIHMADEAVYDQKLSEVLDNIVGNPRTKFVHRDLCANYYPHDQL